MRLPELQALESFEEPEVILKFARDFKIPVSDSKILFKETMKMLWLMVKHTQDVEKPGDISVPRTFVLQKSMEPLDKMWHEFILFTREYHEFCDRFFGEYIHHIPCSEKEFQAFQQRKVERQEAFERTERNELRVFVRYIQENLGSDTLEVWFKKLPQWRLA